MQHVNCWDMRWSLARPAALKSPASLESAWAPASRKNLSESITLNVRNDGLAEVAHTIRRKRLPVHHYGYCQHRVCTFIGVDVITLCSFQVAWQWPAIIPGRCLSSAPLSE